MINADVKLFPERSNHSKSLGRFEKTSKKLDDDDESIVFLWKISRFNFLGKLGEVMVEKETPFGKEQL